MDNANRGARNRSDATDLLLQIARCTIVERCLNGDTSHPCATIVRSQGVSSLDEFQAPEPWSGDLSVAPILFLSSNPSIGQATYDQYPRASWPDNATFEYFDYRFGGSQHATIAQGIFHASQLGQKGVRPVPFWRSVRKCAAEILEKRPGQVEAGVDYALTEIVRCKSKHEIGVAEATSTCVERYLDPTLAISSARLVVVLGKHARNVMSARFNLAPTVPLHERVPIADRERAIVFLRHPSASGGGKSLGAHLTPQELDRLRAWLRSAS